MFLKCYFHLVANLEIALEDGKFCCVLATPNLKYALPINQMGRSNRSFFILTILSPSFFHFRELIEHGNPHAYMNGEKYFLCKMHDKLMHQV